MNRKKLTGAMLIVMVLLAGCSGDGLEGGIQRLRDYYKEPERGELKVKTLAVDSLSNYTSFTYVGNIEEGSSVPMSFQAGGNVLEVYVRNGQRVTKGQLLCTVDATSVRSMLATARAKLSQAEDGYKRVKQVYDAGGVSEVRFMDVKTQLEEARSSVEGLQKQVNNCSLRSPIDGVVCNCDIHVGQNLLPDQQAMVIVNMQNLKVKMSVAENKISNMNEGDKGIATLPALGNIRIPCAIVEKGIMANELTHTYDVRLVLNPDTSITREVLGKLLPGMVAKVNMMSQQHDGFILPSYCIQNGHNQTTVWVVRDSVAERTVIEVGQFVGDNVFVTGGLNQGDQVVVSGFQKLFTGAKVEVVR